MRIEPHFFRLTCRRLIEERIFLPRRMNNCVQPAGTANGPTCPAGTLAWQVAIYRIVLFCAKEFPPDTITIHLKIYNDCPGCHFLMKNVRVLKRKARVRVDETGEIMSLGDWMKERSAEQMRLEIDQLLAVFNRHLEDVSSRKDLEDIYLSMVSMTMDTRHLIPVSRKDAYSEDVMDGDPNGR